MEESVRQLNITTTEEQINELATQHFEEQALVSGRWESQLDALWHTQRNQFRAWLMNTLRDYQTTNNLNTPTNSPLATFSPPLGTSAPPADTVPPAPRPPRLEESFTIHLGSQLKQTHNIRIVAADLLEFCTPEYLDNGAETSRRLQTALALYSGELCAGVVAAPPAPPAPPPLRAAARAPDHHFTHARAQAMNILQSIKEPVEQRHQRRLREDSTGPDGGGGGRGGRGRRSGAAGAGDVFVTVHSNLPDLHVLFHLVVDTHRNTDITSRHPSILGLRNILKAACANDVTNLCLPLLLTHELTEDMTVSWCCRRGELVLKCVKGFMLEAAGWGGAELRTLTVLLPRDTPRELFHALAALLPAVFRISNPVYMRNPPR